MEIPLFSDSQLDGLEKRLSAAEVDLASQMHRKSIEAGDDQKYLEFNTLTFLRRLLEEVKYHRAKAQ